MLYSETEAKLKSAEYTMFLQKCVEQRPEHLIAMMSKGFVKHYHLKFITLQKFDEIPFTFDPVYLAMIRLGPQVDCSKYGRYSITLHKRGRMYLSSKGRCTFIAGCIILFDGVRGIQVKEKKLNHPIFNSMLSTIPAINMRLGVT